MVSTVQPQKVLEKDKKIYGLSGKRTKLKNNYPLSRYTAWNKAQ